MTPTILAIFNGDDATLKRVFIRNLSSLIDKESVTLLTKGKEDRHRSAIIEVTNENLNGLGGRRHIRNRKGGEDFRERKEGV